MLKGYRILEKLFMILLLFACLSLVDTKDPSGIHSQSYFEEMEKMMMSPNIYSARRNFFGELVLNKPPRNGNDESNDFQTEECLAPVSEVQRTLRDRYGITDKKEDNNLRFILGQCNPVVLVPGIYSTKLMLTINCKKFYAEKSERKLMEMRLYCNMDICSDKETEEEEHILFPSIVGPFSLLEGDNNKHSMCIGYFEKYFNSNKECPRMKDQSEICLVSNGVKISFYGGTNKTKDDSKCGLTAIQNIISLGMFSFLDALLNKKSSKVFAPMVENFKKMGFSEGFSLAGVPYDYRRFVSTNNFAIQSFKYHINTLYANTGKPVVIIAHSFGTIHSLNYFLQEDKEILQKIKKFVAIGPPFAGAPKLIDIFLNGNHDFDMKKSFFGMEFKVKLDSLGQSMMYNTIPTTVELRPLPIFSRLLKNPKYESFGIAIRERLNMEKGENRASNEDLFSSIFPDIPSLNEKECQAPPSNKFLEGQPPIYTSACKLGMHNVFDCPTLFMDKSTGLGAKALEDSCGNEDSSFLYNVECDSSRKTCLDSLYSRGPYPFGQSSKLDELIQRFNTKHSSTFKQAIDYTFFESKPIFQSKMPSLIDYHRKISKTQSLVIPPIDTMLIYSKFEPTAAAFSYNPSSLREDGFGVKDIQFKGGDGTVPSWSSYLTGLKWLYDKKADKLPQDITLVEYCSPLSQTRYGYQEGTKKSFYAIGCECYNKGYDLKEIKSGSCEHASMLGDLTLIEHIKNVAVVDKRNNENITEDRKQSAKRYDASVNFEKACNNKMKELLDNE